MEIFKTIIPIFLVISIGLLARKRGMIPDAFRGPANQITYLFAIPAMMFRAIAKSDFRGQFEFELLLGTLLPIVIVFAISWLFYRGIGVERKQTGTIVDGSIHGNIGYIGFAVVFYYLGADALARAAILSAFIMLLHNSLAIIVLQVNADRHGSRLEWGHVGMKIAGNPIILTAVIGIVFSVFQIPIPEIIDRTLGIISSMALPLALLVIGASLDFHLKTQHLIYILTACLFKLILMPAIGLWLYKNSGLSVELFLPGLILLMMPVAALVFILASELDGDTRLAANLISVSTALSALTIPIWLALLS
ncbi:MAG: AEC family transporter [bacterium]